MNNVKETTIEGIDSILKLLLENQFLTKEEIKEKGQIDERQFKASMKHLQDGYVSKKKKIIKGVSDMRMNLYYRSDYHEPNGRLTSTQIIS